MTSNRRSFLKKAATTVAATAVAGCAPDLGAPHAGRSLDDKALASLGATVKKMATDLRLLAHMKEIEEPFA